jgi:PEP-CTERM motif
VTNDGLLQLAAPEMIPGNFEQNEDGVLELELGGDTRAQYGSLAVTGNAILEGGLALDLTKGFTLAAGDSFAIFNFSPVGAGIASATDNSSVTFDFSTLSFDGANCLDKGGGVWDCSGLGGLSLTETLGSSSINIDVVPGSSPVPEPGTWELILAGMLGLGGIRLRGRKR